MDQPRRRDVLRYIVAASGATTACFEPPAESVVKRSASRANANIPDPVTNVIPLERSPWPTPDPFLFCAHHDDGYPEGNEEFGPVASLEGRKLGSDFGGKDGWSMYHGRIVPGFPRHPHRGFETVTVVRRGLLDHSDSLGAAARYGRGDVQWLTAGAGIQHAEMFPLLERGAKNPFELFQLWLNLPRANKMVDPHFSMLWSDTIPVQTFEDAEGRATVVTQTAGKLGDVTPPAPPANSWAASADHGVAIWTLKMAPFARWSLPPAPGTNRSLYFFRGSGLGVGNQSFARGHRIDVHPERPVPLENGPDESEILMLQGRPLREPIARRGPFVMNTDREIRQAYEDYRATGFGGWPWKRTDPIHGAEPERFARHADGRVDRPA